MNKRIGPRQIGVLRALAHEAQIAARPDEGWLTSAQLFHALRPNGWQYEAVFSLHKRGLVEATPGRSDRAWRITAAGRDALADAARGGGKAE